LGRLRCDAQSVNQKQAAKLSFNQRFGANQPKARTPISFLILSGEALQLRGKSANIGA
jgi:hypothetical protein